jgi:hypothetical protein
VKAGCGTVVAAAADWVLKRVLVNESSMLQHDDGTSCLAHRQQQQVLDLVINTR